MPHSDTVLYLFTTEKQNTLIVVQQQNSNLSIFVRCCLSYLNRKLIETNKNVIFVIRHD